MDSGARPTASRVDWRAAAGFGDRVMVGVSGGKDSWALVRLLDVSRQCAPIHLPLIAVNVDSGYSDYKHDVIARTCEERGWEYHY